MLNNKNFYPTPRILIDRMLSKIKGNPKRWLEPSAGMGDIVEAIEDKYESSRYYQRDISCIEADPDLQATLRGKGFKLLDSDFLQFSSPDQFDCIIMNPPFDNGDKHLLKAIEILFRGQIVCLLNAETLRNQCSNTRVLLSQTLEDLGAEIEFIQDAFVDAKRKTSVECALIYIKIENTIDEELFDRVSDTAGNVSVESEKEKHSLSTGKTIEELVLRHNEIIAACTSTIMDFHKNRKNICGYLNLTNDKADTNSHRDATGDVQALLNGVLKDIRISYWNKVLDLKEVVARLTDKKRKEFYDQIETQCNMAFTESNIRQFVLNLIGSYEQTLSEAVVDIFDRMTRKFAWDESLHCKNVHYFNGWKTNDAFKCGKKVIIPFYGGGDGGPFRAWGDSRWKLDYSVKGELQDIDLVMNYFDAMDEYTPLITAIEREFANDSNKGSSTYFDFICYKKGTIHLTFRNMDILRRFNVIACKGKGWLPNGYGSTPYSALTVPERDVVQEFEDYVGDYSANTGKSMFAAKNVPQIDL